MTEMPKVIPLCQMGLGVQILGFKLEDNFMAYCWNCLRMPSDMATIREHLNGSNDLLYNDFLDPSFYKSLRIKPRPQIN